METGFIISSFLLISFAILAVADGFYLHIFKYQLHNHKESTTEHLMHTIRAILFPAIVYFLFVLQDCPTGFYVGILLVIIDIMVLITDAFLEKDSRIFMNGLPHWEYILHLLINGFHFASIAVFLTMKLHIENNHIGVLPDLSGFNGFTTFQLIARNLMPGAILIAFIHVITSIKTTRVYWNMLRNTINCC